MRPLYFAHHTESPVILHAPHGGTLIPSQERPYFCVSDNQLREQSLRLTDHFTDVMATEVSSSTGASCLINSLSRLVCDVERFADDSEEMNAVGMGFAYSHGYDRKMIRPLSQETVERIRTQYYQPYTQHFQDMVNEKLETVGNVLILDIHSYPSQTLPYELHGSGPRPEICLGFDSYHLPENDVELAKDIFSQHYTVDFNTPFAGSYVPLEQFHTDNRVRSLMVEIRRDVYMDEESGAMTEWPHKLGQCLTELARSLA